MVTGACTGHLVFLVTALQEVEVEGLMVGSRPSCRGERFVCKRQAEAGRQRQRQEAEAGHGQVEAGRGRGKRRQRQGEAGR